MQVNVNAIEFDFTDETGNDAISPEDQQSIINRCIGNWKTDSEDDLSNTISDATGWCITNVTYSIIS